MNFILVWNTSISDFFFEFFFMSSIMYLLITHFLFSVFHFVVLNTRKYQCVIENRGLSEEKRQKIR